MEPAICARSSSRLKRAFLVTLFLNSVEVFCAKIPRFFANQKNRICTLRTGFFVACLARIDKCISSLRGRGLRPVRATCRSCAKLENKHIMFSLHFSAIPKKPALVENRRFCGRTRGYSLLIGLALQVCVCVCVEIKNLCTRTVCAFESALKRYSGARPRHAPPTQICGQEIVPTHLYKAQGARTIKLLVPLLA